MEEKHLIRQFDLIPKKAREKKVTVIGAGAIGSWVVLSLTKMGFQDVTVIDYDVISDENMNCQFYPPKDIGKPKVEALQELIGIFTGTTIQAEHRAWGTGEKFQGVVVPAVDSMDVRKAVWETHKNAFGCELVVDPRMGAEIIRLFAVQPFKPTNGYEKTLTDEKVTLQEACTAKATIYTANLAAGLVCKTIKDFATGGTFYRMLNWDLPTMSMNFTDSKGDFQITTNPKEPIHGPTE